MTDDMGYYETEIWLRGINTIRQFLTDIESIEGRICFKVGNVSINARSTMSVFTLDLSNCVSVTYLGSDVKCFKEVMNKYE